MRMIFIRHGETTGDIEDRYGGDYDDHLSPEGIKQCEALAQELKEKNIEHIFSSPLIRAQETAKIISQNVIPITVEQDAKERNHYGILTGEIKSIAQQNYPELVEQVKDRLNTIEGAEPHEDFKHRICAAFTRISSTTAKECIAVVWHGGPMRVLFGDILKKEGFPHKIGDCAWVELQQNGDQFTVIDSRRIE